MAATVTVRVDYGAGPTTSGSITGIDLISADNATNSLANRVANPITIGNRSYEKWVKAYVEVAPDNKIENFRVWGDGAVEAGTILYIGSTGSGNYTTPVATASAVATTNFTVCTSGSKFSWSSGSINGVGAVSNYLVFQLDTNAGAGVGNWGAPGETISYSFDES